MKPIELENRHPNSPWSYGHVIRPALHKIRPTGFDKSGDLEGIFAGEFRQSNTRPNTWHVRSGHVTTER